MVVGPDGRPLGMARVPQQSTDDDGDEQQGVGAMVEQPAKVMRIGTMIKQLLEEVRSAPLDDASPRPAPQIPSSSIEELEEGLAPELRDELNRLTRRSPTTPPPATPSSGSRRPSWWAGWRACSRASRRPCSPSRWRRGRSWSRCGAGSRRVPAAPGSAPAGGHSAAGTGQYL